MANKTLQTRAIKLVGNLLMARRNGNITAEQRAYEALRNFCTTNNLDMSNVITGATRQLQGSVAAIMNSLV